MGSFIKFLSSAPSPSQVLSAFANPSEFDLCYLMADESYGPSERRLGRTLIGKGHMVSDGIDTPSLSAL